MSTDRDDGAVRQGGTQLREIPVREAIGLRLAHDLTRIDPGRFKGRLFKRGHLITEEDIPGMLDIGKEHIYVMELGEGDIHEDDAACRMAKALADEQLFLSAPQEGKVSVKSPIVGLAQIARCVVEEVNELGDIALATVKNHTVVRTASPIAATRAIPLVVPREKVEQVERIAACYREKHGCAPLRVRPLRKLRAGLLTTGNEIYYGRIKDRFGPAVEQKLSALGSEVAEHIFAPDDKDIIVNRIQYLLQKDYDIILVTGGMSVDPDDRTPGAIKAAGAEIVSYGTPMLPGSMLLMSYMGEVPVLGLPGCVMHDPYTSFDVLLPRILAGDRIERQDIVEMGYGGLLGC
ncbi:molybdopterin-binding protein [Paenibacillus sp. J5C_2022]|uniref:molybdopterin-binding protein n=1 Tax=Paenibacillus sp. J5C2022 TaxID=2977129 RepID=UPI0021D31E7E|nr:molybdopterin-binding protein [Paenibacillus sp. J5C2022]MCU6711837.1 molybdopterin-binding protein [Paenibacillus sp. J5C2022]